MHTHRSKKTPAAPATTAAVESTPKTLAASSGGTAGGGLRGGWIGGAAGGAGGAPGEKTHSLGGGGGLGPSKAQPGG